MSEPMPTPFDIRLMNIAATALYLAFAVMVLAAMVVWVLRHPVFSLTGITVQGDVSHNNALTLKANVLPRLRGSVFTMDLGAVRSTFESVPWVRQAVVHREFPNRLRVQLSEHQVAAYWGLEGESRMVNSFGEVFEANPGDVEQEDLPRLNGPEGQAQQVLDMYRRLQPEFDKLDLALDQLELTQRGSWRAQLDSGAVIEIGRGSNEELMERTRRFLRTLTQATARYGRRPGSIESADLRHSEAYALRLRGVTTVSADSGKK